MLHAHRVLLLATVLAFLAGSPLIADSSAPLPGSQLPAGAVARLGAVRLTHRQKAFDAAFSPDGKRLVSIGADLTIKLWDSSTGRLLRRFESEGKMFPVSVAYSPDGQHVATGDARGEVVLWDVSTGKRAFTLRGHSKYVSVVAFAPDGKTLASSSADETARLWDVAGKRERQVLRGHHARVWAVAFNHDGRTVATCGSDGLVKLWDAANGQERATLRGHTGPVHMVAFSADGRKVASSSQDRTVKVWDAATGKPERTLEGHPGLIASLTFAPSGLLLAAGCERADNRAREIFGEIHLWDAASGKRRQILKGHRGPVNVVTFAPHGRTLASISFDATIRFWDVETGRERCSVPGHAQAVRALAWSPDGQTLVSASDDQTVQLWDATAGLTAIKPRATLRGHYHAVRAVAVAPVGRTLATGDAKGLIRIWDLPSGKLRYFLSPDSDKIISLDFAPDGKTLASTDGSQLRLWDLDEAAQTAKEREPLTRDIFGAWNAVFSPDAKSLASVWMYETVLVWDLKGKFPQLVPDEAGTLQNSKLAAAQSAPLAFAPGGRLLAVGHSDGAVQLLDMTTKTERTVLRKHTGAVAGVVFSPDGKTLISASQDGTVTLWEVLTGQERATLEGHSGPVTCLALRPDGRTLASGSEDTTILLWDLLAPPAGRSLPAKLTAAERQTLWKELSGEDAARAYQVVRLLLQQPQRAVALFQEQLTSVKGPDASRIDQLIADLDNDQFDKREKASQELEKLGVLAEPALRRARDKDSSPEMRRRINVLLEALKKGEPLPQQRQAARMTEVLERLATPEARQLLRKLADGSSGAWFAAEAEAALRRLDGRKPAGKHREK